MTKQEFESFLDVKSREAKAEPEIDWNARREKWLKWLGQFYDTVELWLRDYIDTKKIQMEKVDVTLDEEYIGRYRAESRVLILGKDRVTLKPIGTLLIGTRGRVDMEGPKGSVKFILTGKYSNGIHISISVKGQPKSPKPKKERPEEFVWKIISPGPRIQFIELTPDVFFEALMEVVNG